jgi:SAM-dependent methyltransferase
MPPVSPIKAFFERIGAARKERTLNAYYWQEITRYLAYFSHPDARVLEIGCGNGDLLAGLQGARKVGIDCSENHISWARDRHAGSGIDFRVMDADNIQLNESFDLIVLSNLIGHTSDIQQVLEQVMTCCHPYTKVVVQYYNSLWEPAIRLAEWIGLKQRTPSQNWLRMGDINNLLGLAGFQVYRNARRMLLPLNIPILAPLANTYLDKIPLLRFFGLNLYSFAMPAPGAFPEAAYSVSVVIPARNESGNIEHAVARMPRFSRHLEIIFVEGNSTDDTWETIREIQQKYRSTHDIKIARQPGKGKGDAVRTGFDIASGDILMILDADLTVPPEDLPKFYRAIAGAKGDFINGSRMVYPMEKGAMRSLNYLGNYFFSKMFTWLLDQPFNDTLCGTKVLFRSDYQKLVKNRAYFGAFDPFGDYDLIFGAHKLNLKTVEIPIRYKERTYGTTNISRFSHGLLLLRMCLFASVRCKFI